VNWKVIERYPEPPLEQSWLRCLSECDYPSHYAGPAYFREPFFSDRRPFAVLAIDADRVMGALTGVREGRTLTAGLNVRPQGCCRLGADRVKVGAALAGGLREAGGRDMDLLQVFTWSPIEGLEDSGFASKEFPGEQGIVVLDLTQGPDRLFRGFSENRRTNIRKAQKLGVTVDQASSEEEFKEYYGIYVDWGNRKRVPCNSWAQVLAALLLRDHRRLFVARFEGRMLGGVIVRFQSGGFIEYAANCSIQEEQKFKPNDLLHWRIIEWACREGFRQYSLGGAHLFLRKFGGDLHTTYRYRRDLTWLRRHDVGDRLRALLREGLRRLPPSIQERLRLALGRTA